MCVYTCTHMYTYYIYICVCAYAHIGLDSEPQKLHARNNTDPGTRLKGYLYGELLRRSWHTTEIQMSPHHNTSLPGLGF